MSLGPLCKDCGTRNQQYTKLGRTFQAKETKSNSNKRKHVKERSVQQETTEFAGEWRNTRWKVETTKFGRDYEEHA